MLDQEACVGARSDPLGRRRTRDVADTFLVIDEHLRESIGLAQREGWAVLAYLLGMAREQLQNDLKRDGGTMMTHLADMDAADLLAGVRDLMEQAR